MRMSVEREAGMDEATGFPKKDAQLLKYFKSILHYIYLPSLSRSEIFLILKKGRLLWETLHFKM